MSSRALDDPVLERRRLAALEQIRQIGDPVLRAPALDGDRVRRRPARRGRADGRDHARRPRRRARGPAGGLAAPPRGREFGDEDEQPIALVNPEITWRSEEEEADFEGCLSIGEISVEVPRAVAIRVRRRTSRADTIELAPEGFFARVIQHELDHLDGVLILDRTAPEQRREALKALRDGG